MNFKHFIFFLTFIFTSASGDEDLSLRDIYVITDVITPGDISSGQTLSSSKLNTQFQRDTASLLETFTGIHSANNGSVSSIPYMHGFNDDRIRISVDGVDLNSACTSHSDTDLSFVNIDDVDFVKVFAGITPVSMGGDSIAGTIKIKTKKPKFNSTQEWSESANIKSFYKSNSDEQGVNIKTNLVTDTAYIQYSGTYSQANNYSSASSFKSESYGGSSDKSSIGNDEVGSSGYRMENHQLSYGYQLENHLLELKLDYQNMPYQGFVNQRMDVIGQNSHKINLTDTINFSWGVVELQAYHHQVETKMNFGKNKNFIYGAAQGMSMTHHGYTTGLNAVADMVLNDKTSVKYGLETQMYEVDDSWDPTGGMMMAPNVMKNINDGKRDRYSLFVEVERQWSKAWFSQQGIRLTQISMDTGNVQGYKESIYGTDATNFNQAQKSKQDTHVDVTFSTSYSPNLYQTHEFGYSLKNRSPTLQERYLWSNTAMANSMANWFGDGNGYVGDIDLDKETAHTFAYAAIFHDSNKNVWNLHINPYLTYVDDYIDAVSYVSRDDGFRTLTLGNQKAKLYGIDIRGNINIGSVNTLGHFTINGQLNYSRGQNTETNDDLYHVMPLNLKLSLDQQLNRWTNSINIQLVDNKKHTNDMRQELQTSGYALVDLKSSYQQDDFLINVGIYNLFDRDYDHPLGGVYLGQGRTMSTDTSGVTYANASNVPGMGRALYSSIQYNF